MTVYICMYIFVHTCTNTYFSTQKPTHFCEHLVSLSFFISLYLPRTHIRDGDWKGDRRRQSGCCRTRQGASSTCHPSLVNLVHPARSLFLFCARSLSRSSSSLSPLSRMCSLSLSLSLFSLAVALNSPSSSGLLPSPPSSLIPARLLSLSLSLARTRSLLLSSCLALPARAFPAPPPLPLCQ